jgi:hypothetical protein
LPLGDGSRLDKEQKSPPPPVYPGDTGPKDSIGGHHSRLLPASLIDRELVSESCNFYLKG